MKYNVAEKVFSIRPQTQHIDQNINGFQECFNYIYGDIATVRFVCSVFLITHSKLYYIFEVEVHDKVAHNRMKLTDERFMYLLSDWRETYQQYQHDKENNNKAMDVYSNF